jgi:hypothetical protein
VMALLFNPATSKVYTGIPRRSCRPVHWGYCEGQCVDRLLMVRSTDQDTGLLILVDVDGVVELLELDILAPVLCILELTEGFAGNKLART